MELGEINDKKKGLSNQGAKGKVRGGQGRESL